MSASTFDVAFLGTMAPYTCVHTTEQFAEIFRLLGQTSTLRVCEPVLPSTAMKVFSPLQRSGDDLVTTLKLTGFVNVNVEETVSPTDAQREAILQHVQKNRPDVTEEKLRELKLVTVVAVTPDFDVLESAPLPMALNRKKKTPAAAPSKPSVWTVAATDFGDDMDLVDEDDLLDDSDKVKPDAAALSSGCAPAEPGAKKRACKDCSCGLKEMEASGKDEFEAAPESSCGSCYLGDAFRCGTCPYLGMPAFESGQKVALTTRQLKADL
ncbi:hypothetical protein SARC_01726 [Sphaeroforma arctica JP610]|uniref:Anamorsin homolog n=1 Tax=Sphaeroforma arctica JP610 TaxID=667725 RepID=A0A0L0GAV4_9EUKA|nr:hypothetical protein SARC_01726 [Sphaeroforma arctica JP610]KNC86110.1 hypothetical protein SARC_01726 [Sphaeroforma arctica JP610]|eukprot:XP_014160012.1 hypothetical protein SARC_01726 [Sphaeroforma arctica JP610]